MWQNAASEARCVADVHFAGAVGANLDEAHGHVVASGIETEGLSDAALRSMYNSSVMIPAVLFLLVFLILRFFYPLSKKRIEELQIQKEEAYRKLNEAK